MDIRVYNQFEIALQYSKAVTYFPPDEIEFG